MARWPKATFRGRRARPSRPVSELTGEIAAIKTKLRSDRVTSFATRSTVALTDDRGPVPAGFSRSELADGENKGPRLSTNHPACVGVAVVDGRGDGDLVSCHERRGDAVKALEAWKQKGRSR